MKAIKASEQIDHQHFIMVSTYDSRREAFDASGDLKPYTIAKHYADDYLRHANLKYTIVHPGALTNEHETQQFKYTIVHPGALTNEHETQQFNMSAQFENVQNPSITREDVAEVLVSVLTDEVLQVTNSKSSMVICHY